MLQRTRRAAQASPAIPAGSERLSVANPLAAATPVEPLRSRKRRATMHHIQETAVDLFERDGFENVTIEQIAAAADVSPSTVYRYFGTKESLVLQDEYDEQMIAMVLASLETQDLASAAHGALAILDDPDFQADLGLSRRRTRLWLDTPAIRIAGYAMIAGYAERLAQGLSDARAGALPLHDARVITSAWLAGLMAGLENWWEDGCEGPVDPYVDRAVTLLTRPGGPNG